MSTQSAVVDGSASRSRPRRPFPCFGLLTAFVVAVAFSLALGWFTWQLKSVQEHDAALETLQRANVGLTFDTDMVLYTGPADMGMQRTPPQWSEQVSRALGLSESPRLEAAYFVDEAYASYGDIMWIEGDQEDNPAEPEELEAALDVLHVFPHLAEIHLRGPSFAGSAVENLAKVPSLRSLTIDQTKLDGSALRKLAEHVSIEDIAIGGSNSEVVRSIGVFKELRSVKITNMSLDREDVQAIASLPGLTSLLWFDAQLPDDPELFAPLDGSPTLEVLRVKADYRKAAEIALPDLPKLQQVQLVGFSDGSLKNWSAPDGLDRALLEWPFSQEVVTDFSSRHPNCEVDFEASTFRAGTIVPFDSPSTPRRTLAKPTVEEE